MDIINHLSERNKLIFDNFILCNEMNELVMSLNKISKSEMDAFFNTKANRKEFPDQNFGDSTKLKVDYTVQLMNEKDIYSNNN